MDSSDDRERKIIMEFCHLLEKSKLFFNTLRELPQYGHKQWHSFFARTFDVYTNLWRFQQQHRPILDTKYGLKRWQIGEIASKIGQLYYHFYLKTSDTAYLNEAFSFYYTIRLRSYYTKASEEDKCELMVKKLRYYARFIVVCLLLKKVRLVRELIKELDRQIIEYGNTYDPEDQIEWTVVVDEVKSFIQAESMVSVIHPDNYPVILSHRFSSLTTPRVERSAHMNLTLQEILIVGSTSQQVKFSELTMDMFRILQTFEREPAGEQQHMCEDFSRTIFISTPCGPTNKGYDIENGPRRDNPHKYLLFKPSPSQILVYLSSGCNDLPPYGALLLYISADGYIPSPGKHAEDYAAVHSEKDVHDGAHKTGWNYHVQPYREQAKLHFQCWLQSGKPTSRPLYERMHESRKQFKNKLKWSGYDAGGVITTSKSDIYKEYSRDRNKPPPASKHKEVQCLYPGDLYPYTRRPLFIIIDSDNSYAFGNIPRHFGQPLVILMSPLEIPGPLNDRRDQGNLFTLFLHSPLMAFCHCCMLHSVSLVVWNRAQVIVDTFMAEASMVLTTNSKIDTVYYSFMGDDYLRLLLVRYIFCEVTIRCHRAFRGRTQLPRSMPPMPDEIFDHPILNRCIMDLAGHLQVMGCVFREYCSYAGPKMTASELNVGRGGYFHPVSDADEELCLKNQGTEPFFGTTAANWASGSGQKSEDIRHDAIKVRFKLGA